MILVILVTEMVMGGMWEGLSSVPSASTPGEIERVKSSGGTVGQLTGSGTIGILKV